MIGQTKLKSQIDALVLSNKYPRFSIITGLKGSGRRTLANYIAQKLDYSIVEVGVSIQDVRDVIDNAYTLIEPIIYLIADADTMSVPAQNALLKIAEEPPNNAYVILTALDIENVLCTIQSRAMEFKMYLYNQSELFNYAKTTCDLKGDVLQLSSNVCSTFGEIQTLAKDTSIIEYADKVFNNIGEISGSNSFKIGSKINLTDDDTKYDLQLFWKAFIYKCQTNKAIYSVSWILTTLSYLRELRVVGANKQHLFDMWILSIRKDYMNAVD